MGSGIRNVQEYADTARFEPAQARPARLRVIVYRLVAIEFLAVLLSAGFAIRIYYWTALHAQPPAFLYIPTSIVLGGLYTAIAITFRHYAKIPTQRKFRYVTLGVSAVGLAFSLFLSLLFLLKIAETYSRGTFFFQLIVIVTIVVIIRAVTHDRLRGAIIKNKIEARRVVLLGRDVHCAAIAEQFAESGLRVQTTIPFPSPHSTADESAPLDAALLRQITQRCRSFYADEILVLATEKDVRNVELLAGALSELPTPLHVMPIGLKDILAASHFSELGAIPTFQLSQPPLSLVDLFIKRSFDLIGATVGLIILFPLMIAVAAVIALELKASPIFRQHRHGFNNYPIRVFKFRTMKVVEDGDKFKQAVRNDPRITKFGGLLRKTNIDELPQLINVLLGEMSLVGPRPHPIALNERFQDVLTPLFRRHNVKPGLTGWAQVNGCRGETSTLEKMQKRLEYDLYYVDHWSFLFDLQIILMTFLSKDAYSNAF
jgi:Undecaprenyl-phosphate glucose phosphotransferase